MSQALDNLAEIYAYNSSIIPLGDYKAKHLPLNIESELSKLFSAITITSSTESIGEIRYLYPIDRKIKITARYNQQPLQGLLLRASITDGLSDWKNNVQELRQTNNNGHTQIKLGRILSKQARQTMVVDLDSKNYKRILEKVDYGDLYLLPNWYLSFDSTLTRYAADLIEIPLNIETNVDIYIPTNTLYYKDFKRFLAGEKDVKITQFFLSACWIWCCGSSLKLG